MAWPAADPLESLPPGPPVRSCFLFACVSAFSGLGEVGVHLRVCGLGFRMWIWGSGLWFMGWGL